MGLGGFGGAGPEGPPNVTEGAGQAPPLTGCLRPIHTLGTAVKKPAARLGFGVFGDFTLQPRTRWVYPSLDEHPVSLDPPPRPRAQENTLEFNFRRIFCKFRPESGEFMKEIWGASNRNPGRGQALIRLESEYLEFGRPCFQHKRHIAGRTGNQTSHHDVIGHRCR